MRKYLNIVEAGAFLRLGRTTLYQYVHYRKIPFIKIGERILFDQADLERWVETKKKKMVKRD